MSFRLVRNTSGHKLSRGYLVKDADVDEDLYNQIDNLNKQVSRELNNHLFGDEWVVKKKWYRWLKFWNWRLRLKEDES